jgi:hypothetical protein
MKSKIWQFSTDTDNTNAMQLRGITCVITGIVTNYIDVSAIIGAEVYSEQSGTYYTEYNGEYVLIVNCNEPVVSITVSHKSFDSKTVTIIVEPGTVTVLITVYLQIHLLFQPQLH